MRSLPVHRHWGCLALPFFCLLFAGCQCRNPALTQTCELELCDGVDNDCDGQVDEDLGELGCGAGSCARSVARCVGGTEQGGWPVVQSPFCY